jgi:hypothetical protein
MRCDDGDAATVTGGLWEGSEEAVASTSVKGRRRRHHVKEGGTVEGNEHEEM